MLASTPFQTTLAGLNRQHMPILNRIWGAPAIDPSLITALGEAGDIRRIKNGLAFDLPGGQTIEWWRERSLVQSVKTAGKNLMAFFKRPTGRRGEWRRNGFLHRDDGPAIEWSDNS